MVRNRGTIGGSLAHSDPAADYPACILALNASLTIESAGGTRTVEADHFFTGMFATAVGPAEVLTAVSVPVSGPGVGMAYEKFAHPASRYAITGVAAVLRAEGGVCREARIAVTGATPHTMRLAALEGTLVGKALDPAGIAAACTGLLPADDLMGDQFASQEYRAQLVDVLTARALARAWARTA